MAKHVKGSLFLEYVLMIKKLKNVNWDKYLTLEDRDIIDQLILPSQWYPLDTYQRCGEAVFHELAKGNLEMARLWGRSSMDSLAEIYKNLLVDAKDPVKSLEKFRITYRRLFDFEGFQIQANGERGVRITISPDFGTLAIAAYTFQMLGAFERLIELSGGSEIQWDFPHKYWDGDFHTVLDLNWTAALAKEKQDRQVA